MMVRLPRIFQPAIFSLSQKVQERPVSEKSRLDQVDNVACNGSGSIAVLRQAHPRGGGSIAIPGRMAQYGAHTLELLALSENERRNGGRFACWHSATGQASIRREKFCPETGIGKETRQAPGTDRVKPATAGPAMVKPEISTW